MYRAVPWSVNGHAVGFVRSRWSAVMVKVTFEAGCTTGAKRSCTVCTTRQHLYKRERIEAGFRDMQKCQLS